MDEAAVKLIQLLLFRLEHISADSVWAHRASGIRGSLFRILESIEQGEIVPPSRLESLLASGFGILEHVLKENFKQRNAH
jgi:hypothetical protein